MTYTCTACACWHVVPNVRCLLSIGRGRDLPPPQRELRKEGDR
jgi:hypothetical protein